MKKLHRKPPQRLFPPPHHLLSPPHHPGGYPSGRAKFVVNTTCRKVLGNHVWKHTSVKKSQRKKHLNKIPYFTVLGQITSIHRHAKAVYGSKRDRKIVFRRFSGSEHECEIFHAKSSSSKGLKKHNCMVHGINLLHCTRNVQKRSVLQRFKQTQESLFWFR